jgi:glycosyltransferase involved in cell wall biosynthesis
MTDAPDAAPPVRVSVVTLTCDRPHLIERAMASVRTQRFRSWELLVVHDGGNDSIAEIVRAWAADEPRVRYFRRREKQGIADAYNFALDRARGDYIAILDDDDHWIAPDKLEKQVAFLDTHPEYAACGGGMIAVDGAGHELIRYLKPQSDAEIRRWALVANPMAHSTVMFRRIGNDGPARYDTSLGGFHDWNLFLTLGISGKLYNFPELFTCYTLWPSNASFHQQRASVRSAITIVRRHRRRYRGVTIAAVLVSLHWLYAHLPDGIRRRSFIHVSRVKKWIFGRRPREHAAVLAGPPPIGSGAAVAGTRPGTTS